MSRNTFRSVAFALAFTLLLLDKSLMVFQVRTALQIPPRYAIVIGAVAAMMAIYLIARGVVDE